jgi:phospholipase/carboxylesterase
MFGGKRVEISGTRRMTRRRFGAVAGGAIVSFAVGGACYGNELGQTDGGRITARPRKPGSSPGTGTRALGLGETRDAILQQPSGGSSAPRPLLVLLHGAGGSGAGILRRLGSAALDAEVAVLAPDSRNGTWDAIRGGFGRDVTFLNRALERVFETAPVDPARIAVGGFSDGATYALSLGLMNGDLFRRILAFSPGFVVGGAAQGRPAIFVSHGTVDRILPIDRCSRMIVSTLQRRGFNVTFREFEGGHEVPADIAREGMRWVAGIR